MIKDKIESEGIEGKKGSEIPQNHGLEGMIGSETIGRECIRKREGSSEKGVCEMTIMESLKVLTMN